MSAALTKDSKPKPPNLQHVLAVALELAIVAVLAAHKAWEGLALAAAYAWFSATWNALVSWGKDD